MNWTRNAACIPNSWRQRKRPSAVILFCCYYTRYQLVQTYCIFSLLQRNTVGVCLYSCVRVYLVVATDNRTWWPSSTSQVSILIQFCTAEERKENVYLASPQTHFYKLRHTGTSKRYGIPNDSPTATSNRSAVSDIKKRSWFIKYSYIQQTVHQKIMYVLSW